MENTIQNLAKTFVGESQAKSQVKRRTLSILFLLLLGAFLISIAPITEAASVPEGATIKTVDNPDVYIVKYKNGKQFKRLVLNPQVFESYGHLRWEDILTIDQNIMNSFVVSDLVRAVGDDTIYKLYPQGDTGEKRWIKDANTFASLECDSDSIYEINEVDRNFYVTGAPLEIGDNCEGVKIGTQCWAKENLNVGTMINGDDGQKNNSVTEKYCYDNDEANCNIYGGLYLWDEAMSYGTAEEARGICLDGWHIPTDEDWKILEIELGMTQSQADSTGDRGTDQGDKLKVASICQEGMSCGSSNFNAFLAGMWSTVSFYNISSPFWSSTKEDNNAWIRSLYLYSSGIGRNWYSKYYGLSVRCLKD